MAHQYSGMYWKNARAVAVGRLLRLQPNRDKKEILEDIRRLAYRDNTPLTLRQRYQLECLADEAILEGMSIV